MSEFVKLFKDFITRDIMYILGGLFIIISFAYLLGMLKSLDFTNIEYILVIGFAYTLGYVFQETLSMTGIVTTAHFKPGKIVKFYSKLFTRTEWTDIKDFDEV